MKNKLVDLNNHLFEQLERLGDTDVKGDELKEEMSRAKAMTGVASKIIENATLVFEANKLKAEYMGAVPGVDSEGMSLLTGGEKNEKP